MNTIYNNMTALSEENLDEVQGGSLLAIALGALVAMHGVLVGGTIYCYTSK